MKLFTSRGNLSLAMVALAASMAPSQAAPPTVTPSPGYDARLQEQRNPPAVYEPVVRNARPASRRRVKHVH